jgi:glycosyltransferase involved in cell wall biosynthesis
MSTEKRIIHVLGRLNRAGAEMRTLDVMRRLNDREYKCDFVCLSGLPGDLDDEVRQLGGGVHYIRLGWNLSSRFQRLLRERKIDVVHSHVHLSSGFILRCAAQAGVPCRIAHFRSVRCGEKSGLRRRLQGRAMRLWLHRHATLILGNGESSIKFGWRPDWAADPRAAVIYNGLDTTPFAPPIDADAVRREFGWPADCPLGIHVGRMHPAKNHLRLIEIVQGVVKLMPTLRFLLVGRESAAISQLLRSRIASLGLEHRVLLAGVRNDVPRLLKAADVMVFPSLWEGLPGAVLESRAAGTPVVASDISSVREIAERLNGISCLPLSLSNEVWARRVIAMMSSLNNPQRDVARRAIEESVYNVKSCLYAHQLAWQGAPGTTIRAWYDKESCQARAVT